MSTYRAHQDKKGITTGVVSWLTALAVTLSLLIGASSARAMGRVQFLEHLSSKDATRLLENIEWNRYRTIQINIAQVNLTELEGWQDSVVILDLKGDEWKVEFPKDYYLSANRFFFVDGANPRPVEGDARVAALSLLEGNRLKVYHIRLGGAESLGRAIILTPYTIRVSTIGDAIQIKLDNQVPNDQQE